MGNFQSALQQVSIQETQLSEINQRCQESATASLSNVQITAIGSHLGNVSLTNSLSVTDLSCVLSAVDKTTANNVIAQSATQAIKTLPFQVNVNNSDIRNIAEVYSYQQAIISQQCVEQASASLTGASVLFVDTVTGNLTIANTASIGGMSCNLNAGLYQTITDRVEQSAKQKTSVGCCACGFGMIIPILIGLVAMVVVLKTLGKTSFGLGGDEDDTQKVINEASELAIARGFSQGMSQGPPPFTQQGAGYRRAPG